jgi:hypothetical protein
MVCHVISVLFHSFLFNTTHALDECTETITGNWMLYDGVSLLNLCVNGMVYNLGTAQCIEGKADGS